MGTIQKTVNLAKSIFSRKQRDSVHKSRGERKRIERQESKKERRNDGSLKYDDKYLGGGGKRGVASSDAVMYTPKRTKLKGYQRDHATGKVVR